MNTRLYHVVAINERTGHRERCSSATPMTHDEACVFVSKFTPAKNVRIQLEEIMKSTPLYTVRDRASNVVAGLVDVERENALLSMLTPNGYGTSLHGPDACSFDTMHSVGDVIQATDRLGVVYWIERTR